MVDSVRALAAIESPSDDAAALERCAAALSSLLAESGGSVDRPPGSRGVAHVRATWPGDGPRALLIGHFDTVYPLGQLARQPLDVREGRLFGPGVYDMKAGLVIAMAAARALSAETSRPRRPHITLLATADEEIGSGTSRQLIEQMASESAAVLVLEPATASGAVKTARKGVGEFEILLAGVPAHAGVDPAAGASAVHELARLVLALEGLANPQRGLTVNVGVISGGTRSNVVAEQARAVVDVRIAYGADAPRIEEQIRTLAPGDPRVRIRVTGGVNRPPMERTAGVVRLFEMAREVAAEQGWVLTEGATGGGSDGNFTAALGVPTLDGLGAVGAGAHALHEHVVIKDLPVRAALLAGLLAKLGDNGLRS